MCWYGKRRSVAAWTRAASEDDKAMFPCGIERDVVHKRAALCPDATREPRMPGIVVCPVILSRN